MKIDNIQPRNRGLGRGSSVGNAFNQPRDA
jgi:hypothetical protein